MFRKALAFVPLVAFLLAGCPDRSASPPQGQAEEPAQVAGKVERLADVGEQWDALVERFARRRERVDPVPLGQGMGCLGGHCS